MRINPVLIWKLEKFNYEKKPCLWITGRLYVIHTYEKKLIWTDFQGMTTLIGKLESFSGARINPVLIWKLEKFNEEKKPCLWITGRLYVIHTYEKKLIWTDFQGMTTLIGKWEPFSGDVYQSSPNLKIWKI